MMKNGSNGQGGRPTCSLKFIQQSHSILIQSLFKKDINNNYEMISIEIIVMLQSLNKLSEKTIFIW